MALLHLMAACGRDQGVVVEAATVDHGLRAGSAEEADFVRRTCQDIDIQHETLRWSGWNGQGNLQAEARAARYRLLAHWAERRGLDVVALGHTLDDQAETFLMRLAREAGVDGLAAMKGWFERDGAAFWRPVLALERTALRGYLKRHGQTWCEDPSNEDEDFDRVKARKALVVLGAIGIEPGRLRGVALNMASASDTLKRVTCETAERLAVVEAGDVVFDRRALLEGPGEIHRRLLAHALVWVSAADYLPRRDALRDLDRAIRRGQGHTLHGCFVTTDDKSVRVAREYNAVKDAAAPLGGVWDNRWLVAGPPCDGLEIRALGAAVRHCPDWRNTALPRTSLMASPGVWQGDTLVAAPIAGYPGGYSAEIVHPQGHFAASVLSH